MYRALALIVLAGCAAAPPPDPGVRQDPPVSRDDVTASPLRVETLLRAAARDNASIEAARRRADAALERSGQVAALPDPTLGVSAFIEQIETRNGAVEGGFQLQQRIPWPGKLSARGDLANDEARLARVRAEAAALDIALHVREAHADLAWLERAEAIARESVTLVDRIRDAARLKYSAGLTSQQDVLKAEMERARLEEEARAFADLRTATRERINTLLNRPPGSKLGTLPELPEPRWSGDLPALLEEARQARPEIRAAREAVRAAETLERLAGLESVPDVTLGVQYSLVDDTSLPGAPDPGKDSWGITLGVNLPIWTGRTGAARREAMHRRRASESALAQVEYDTQGDLARLLARVRTALRQVALNRDTLVPQARRTLAVAESEYAAAPSRVDLDAVVDAQRRLLRFQLALERARADARHVVANLERVLGRPPIEGEGR